jgi:hypothetical protein
MSQKIQSPSGLNKVHFWAKNAFNPEQKGYALKRIMKQKEVPVLSCKETMSFIK